MKTIRRQALLSVGMASIALTALVFGRFSYSHHSFPATYVEGETARIEGELAAFMCRNPHSYVHVNVTDASGESVRFAVEWGAAAALARQGVNRGTLRPGDFVIVTGLPGRNPEDHRLLLRTIERPSDGFRWGFKEDETFE
jgi:hypothetical protein